MTVTAPQRPHELAADAGEGASAVETIFSQIICGACLQPIGRADAADWDAVSALYAGHRDQCPEAD